LWRFVRCARFQSPRDRGTIVVSGGGVMVEPTDEQLIAACRLGDQRAWGSLVRRYERLVYSIALGMGLSQADAADAAQSVFTELVRSLDSIHDDTAIAAWIGTVTRRTVWRTFERNRRESTLALDTPQHVEAANERIDDLEWIHQGLLRLSPRCRQLILALYFTRAPLSYQELSESLAVPLGSIGPSRARCLEQLRAILESLSEPTNP
jgi:RNA polymerase sigma factor (sigma-70 family)